MSHNLLAPAAAWDLARLPVAYQQITKITSDDPDAGIAISLKPTRPLPDSNIQTRIVNRSAVMLPNTCVIEAVLAHAGKLLNTNVSLINVTSDDSEVSWTMSELVLPDKSSVLVEHKMNCATFVETLSGVCVTHPAERFTAIPPIPSKKSGVTESLLPIYLVLIESVRKLFPNQCHLVKQE